MQLRLILLTLDDKSFLQYFFKTSVAQFFGIIKFQFDFSMIIWNSALLLDMDLDAQMMDVDLDVNYSSNDFSNYDW